MRKLAILIAAVGLFGCSSAGRYQLGSPIQAPNLQSTVVIPVLDTKTGKLTVWSQDGYYGRDLHASEAGSPKPAAK